MTEFTAHFRLPIPDFNQDPWHAELEAAIRGIDTVLYDAILIQNVGNWANSTVYAVGAIVIDAATGLMWTCAVANTSSASPTTFATERTNHPTFWSATATIPQQRGAWTTATSYIPGDFVVNASRYAVCLVAHVSGVFNTDVAAAKWSILIDLSNLGVGINATPEDTIASAATTDIGSKAATRLQVTGAATITSLGIVADTFKILRFQAGATLTNGANLILFGANIVTENNDMAFFSSDSTGKWRCYFYTRASGVPIGQPDASETVKGIAELATQAEVDTGTDDLRIVTPLKLKTRLDALTTSILNTIRDGVGATLDTLKEIADAIGLLAPKANPTFTGTSTFDTIAVTTLSISGGTTFPAGDVLQNDLEPKARAFTTQLYHIRDERSNGTNGGNLSSGSWTTRTLQTEKTDDLGITLSANQFALPAGTYHVEGWAQINFVSSLGYSANASGVSRIRLRNVTDGTTALVGGASNYFISNENGASGAFTNSKQQVTQFISGHFTIAGTKTFELQNFTTLSNTSATEGAATSSGEVEVHADLRIWKIG